MKDSKIFCSGRKISLYSSDEKKTYYAQEFSRLFLDITFLYFPYNAYIMSWEFSQERSASAKIFAPLKSERANYLNDSSRVYRHITHRDEWCIVVQKKMTSSLRFFIFLI